MSMMSIITIPSKSCSPRLESPSYRNAGWEGGMNNVGMTCFFPLLLLRPVSLGGWGVQHTAGTAFASQSACA